MTSRYTATYLSTMVGDREAVGGELGDLVPVELAGGSDRGDRRIDVVDQIAGDPVRDQLAHRASRVGDDRCATGHRLDDAVAERFVEVDQVEQRVRTSQYLGTLGGVDGAEVAHLLAVDVRRDLVAEVLLVLDDSGDVEPATTSAGDLDRVGGALVGVDPSEEQQMLAGIGWIANSSMSMPWWMVAA